ncbi:MAG TPA: glucose 1-dehydrogenase [Noviherbaspirillum sp.]|uniref:glucose 1-dehydrogenase n=1 Tax=Noviherbaspirillum sp. TaxID=1926288 RepID=UPI002B4A1A1E|nr:glucose 1-dehydrogenase [Noviherbaspirillum sp.]HJV84511.1 glucose 1-dehydrogenase [Noviherbaspirillum sp.]
MTGRLQGKVAIVTGGASGIGAACCRRFSEEGAQVVLTDLQEELGQQVAAETGGWFMRQDVTDEVGWESIMAQVRERHGRLDILVNNAGMTSRYSIEDLTLDAWNQAMAVNVTSVMLGCKHAIRMMKTNPGGPSGSIINLASIAAYLGMPDAAAYSASKGAVRLLTKSVAVHCAQQYGKIRCNSIHPGAVDTPIHQSRLSQVADQEAARAGLNRLQPMGRMATATEMANCALFLASDEASFVTGSELLADGGWLAEGGIRNLPQTVGNR